MINIGLGECIITSDKKETLVTHALSSCVALVLQCSKSKVTAMAHIVLPKKTQSHQNNYKDAYFASEIVPKLIDEFLDNTNCDVNNIKVTLIGGADSINKNDIFEVGPKNLKEIRKILKSYELDYDSSETSGHCSRTVEIEVKTGIISVKKHTIII